MIKFKFLSNPKCLYQSFKNALSTYYKIQDIDTLNFKILDYASQGIYQQDQTPLDLFNSHLDSKLFGLKETPSFNNYKKLLQTLFTSLKFQSHFQPIEEKELIHFFSKLYDNRAYNSHLEETMFLSLVTLIKLESKTDNFYSQTLYVLTQSVYNFGPTRDLSRLGLNIKIKSSILKNVAEMFNTYENASPILLDTLLDQIRVLNPHEKSNFIRLLNPQFILQPNFEKPPILCQLISIADTSNINYILNNVDKQLIRQCQSSAGDTAFHFAAETGHSRIFKTLIKKLIDSDIPEYCPLSQVNQLGQTPLMILVKNNHFTCISENISYITLKNIVDIRDNDSKSALDYIINSKNWTFIYNLLTIINDQHPQFLTENASDLLTKSCLSGNVSLYNKIFTYVQIKDFSPDDTFKIILNAVASKNSEMLIHCFKTLPAVSYCEATYGPLLQDNLTQETIKTFKILLDNISEIPEAFFSLYSTLKSRQPLVDLIIDLQLDSFRSYRKGDLIFDEFLEKNKGLILKEITLRGDKQIFNQILYYKHETPFSRDDMLMIIESVIDSSDDEMLNLCLNSFIKYLDTNEINKPLLTKCAIAGKNETLKTLFSFNILPFGFNLLSAATSQERISPLDIQTLLLTVNNYFPNLEKKMMQDFLISNPQKNALYIAASKGKHNICKILIKKYFEYNIPFSHLSPCPVKAAFDNQFKETYFVLLKELSLHSLLDYKYIYLKITKSEIDHLSPKCISNTPHTGPRFIDHNIKLQLEIVEYQRLVRELNPSFIEIIREPLLNLQKTLRQLVDMYYMLNSESTKNECKELKELYKFFNNITRSEKIIIYELESYLHDFNKNLSKLSQQESSNGLTY